MAATIDRRAAVVGLGILLTRSLTARGSTGLSLGDVSQPSKLGPFEWIVGHWISSASAKGRHRDLTWTVSGEGLRGVLVEVIQGVGNANVGVYDLAQGKKGWMLRALEKGRTLLLASDGIENQSFRFERSHSKAGLIILEARMLRNQLWLRRVFGPQHGAALSEGDQFDRASDSVKPQPARKGDPLR
jgi:hypothetical protein